MSTIIEPSNTRFTLVLDGFVFYGLFILMNSNSTFHIITIDVYRNSQSAPCGARRGRFRQKQMRSKSSSAVTHHRNSQSAPCGAQRGRFRQKQMRSKSSSAVTHLRHFEGTGVQLVILALLRNKLLVISTFNYPPKLQYHYNIRVADCG